MRTSRPARGLTGRYHRARSQSALPKADPGIVTPSPVLLPRSAAVEFEARVSPGGSR